MGVNNLSQSDNEHEYLDRAAEVAAKKVARLPKNDPDKMVALIDDIAKEDDIHQGLLVRFKSEVMKKAEQLRKKAKTEQEKQIIGKFEGKVQMVDGHFFPAGLHQNSKLGEFDNSKKVTAAVVAGTVVAGAAMIAVGASFPWLVALGVAEEAARRLLKDKIWGNSLDKELREIQADEVEIEKSRAEIEMLRAEKKSLWQCVKIGSQVFMNQAESRGLPSGGFFNGLEAAYDLRLKQKERAAANQDKLKTLEKKEKNLATRKAALEKALQKAEELRGKGRELFTETFNRANPKGELDLLLDAKETMDENVFDARLEDLRNRVREFGDKVGIVRMEYFLDEKLREKRMAVPLQPGEEQEYMLPANDKEASKEKIQIERWWEKTFDAKLGQRDLEDFIKNARAKNPNFYKKLVAGKVSKKEQKALRFFFTGEAKGLKEKMDKERRMDLTPENVLEMTEMATEVAEDSGDPDKLFKDFAEKWQGRNTQNFGEAYEFLKKGLNPWETKLKAA